MGSLRMQLSTVRELIDKALQVAERLHEHVLSAHLRDALHAVDLSLGDLGDTDRSTSAVSGHLPGSIAELATLSSQPIDVESNVAYMRRQFGNQALVAARTTLAYMHLRSDADGAAGWSAIVAKLEDTAG